MAAWTVAWLVSGFAILPYLTIVPGRGCSTRPGDVDGRVRHRGHRAAGRPARGPAARVSAVELPAAVGHLAAPRRVAVLRPRHGRPDRGQARRPAHRRRGDRPGATAAGRGAQ